MWEVIQFTSNSAFTLGFNDGVSIKLYNIKGKAYTTPYQSEAQELADKLNEVK